MQKHIEILVGLFIVAGLAALTMLAVQVSAAGGDGNTFRISASFRNVGGLNTKAPVMVSGVRVGRVGGIEIDQDTYNAVVTMDIEARYDNLPIDTSAAILTAGLLGSQFVGLQPGADDFYLQGGDSLEITQSALQLETLISQLLFKGGDAADDSSK